jgi:hypothetical protein
MALTTKPVDLEIPNAPALRYRPLPALSVGDYLKKHLTQIEHKGVFDHLSLSGFGIGLDKLKRENIDLSTVGLLGQAFTKLLSGEGSFSDHIVEHCKQFHVEVKVGDAWEKLTTVEEINAELAFDQCLDLVYRLFMSAIDPLVRRLSSYDEERRKASKQPSPESQPEN